jgi:hypothetical protein
MIYYDENKYLSAALIKNGLAWHYKRYYLSEELANFENSARLQNRFLIRTQSNPCNGVENLSNR